MEETRLTQLGNLEPKIANGLSYLPIMSINLFASIAFLVTEEKDSYRIRFHAAQSLAVILSIVVSAVVVGVGCTVLVIVAGILDGILGMSILTLLASLLSTLVYLAWLFIVVVGPFGLSILAFMDKPMRVPVLGGLVEKMIGHGDSVS